MESLSDILRRVTQRRTSADGAAGLASEARQAAEEGCERCEGRGWVAPDLPPSAPGFGKARPCVCVEELSAEERLQRLHRYSNLGLLEGLTFRRLECPASSPDARHRFEAARAAAERYAAEPDGWFVLSGPSPSGKTSLAAAIANGCLERGLPTFFMSTPDLLDHLRAAFGPTSDVAYDDLFDRVRNAPALVLDDLGMQSATPWAEEKLYQLLNHRFLGRLPTVVALVGGPEALPERVRTRLLDPRTSQVHRLGSSGPTPALGRIGSLDEGMLQRMTFETFDVRGAPTTDAEGRQSLEIAYRFARAFGRDPHGWVVFTGVPGCGKTHLAVAIAGERVRRGEPVFFVRVSDLLDHLRYTFSPQSQVTYDQLFEEVKSAQLLVVDELGAEVSTPWAREKLHQLIARRYEGRLPTVITTSVAGLDELPPSIASRLSDPSVVELKPIAAPDYRPKERGRYRAAPPTPRRGARRSVRDEE